MALKTVALWAGAAVVLRLFLRTAWTPAVNGQYFCRRWVRLLSPVLLCTVLAACGENPDGAGDRPLPFPTPGRQDLVVLMRPGPLTYMQDENGVIGGLENDLVVEFARELGVPVQYMVVGPEHINEFLATGRYHLAASWLTPQPELNAQHTAPIFMTADVLAQNDSTVPLTDVSQLSGKTLTVMAGSRQAVTAHQLAKKMPEVNVVEFSAGDIIDLLDQLGNDQIDYVVIDQRMEDIANQFVPAIRTSIALSEKQPIVWLLNAQPNPELKAQAQTFIERVHKDGTLARLEERYFGHVHRLKQADVVKFLAEIEKTLPRLRRYFIDAERKTGLDWRLIAALSYQESHWDPLATSFTNVRGIMMLTEDTADYLGVSNRLDVRQSIAAGARYLNELKEISKDAKEPDKTWLALSAYNIGPGAFAAGQRLARYQKVDPYSWYTMKKVLPLLARPGYAEKVRAARARGGEAVILVENVRSFYDILSRREAPLERPVEELLQSAYPTQEHVIVTEDEASAASADVATQQTDDNANVNADSNHSSAKKKADAKSNAKNDGSKVAPQSKQTRDNQSTSEVTGTASGTSAAAQTQLTGNKKPADQAKNQAKKENNKNDEHSSEPVLKLKTSVGLQQ